MAQPWLYTELDKMGFRDILDEQSVQTALAGDSTHHAMACVILRAATGRGTSPSSQPAWHAAREVWANDCDGCRNTIVGALSTHFHDLRRLVEAAARARLAAVARPGADNSPTWVEDLTERRISVQMSGFVSSPFARTLIAKLDAQIERHGSSLHDVRAAAVTALLTSQDAPGAPGQGETASVAAGPLGDDPMTTTLLVFPRALVYWNVDINIGGQARNAIALHLLPGRDDAALVPSCLADLLTDSYARLPHLRASAAPCESVDLALAAVTLHQQGGEFTDLQLAVSTARDALA